jgi:hypothetical protein
MENEKTLSKEDVLNISQENCPMLVFSYGIGSPIATAIAMKEKGFYNHFMWLLEPGVFASQDWLFKKVPAEKYLDKHALKFVYGKNWGLEERKTLAGAITTDLSKPWYKRLYDPIAIVGQALSINWLQIPGVDICSDKAEYLTLVDPDYKLKFPSPTDVNLYTKANGNYAVYGRFRLD